MFKIVDPQNQSIRSFKTHKTFNVTNNDSASFGNFVVRAISGSFRNYSTGSDTMTHIVSGSVSSSYAALPTYHMVKSTYYTDPNDSIYDHKNIIKKLQEKANVFSIPRGLFGEEIKPGSIKLSDTSNSITFDIRDDKHGNLYDYAYSSSWAAYKSGSYPTDIPPISDATSGSQVGNVFYEQGIMVITDTGSYKDVGFGSSYNLEFKATQTHYEHEYIVTAGQYEFNKTMNISATKDRSGSISITTGPEDIFTDAEGTPALDKSGNVQWTGYSPYNMLPPGSEPKGELINNGDFSQMITGLMPGGAITASGWNTDSTATLKTSSLGELVLSASHAAHPTTTARAVKSVSTKIGKRYILTGKYKPSTTTGGGRVLIEESGYFAGTDIASMTLSGSANGGAQDFKLPFTATKETHHIIIAMVNNAKDDTTLWDNFSLKEWHGFESGIGDYKSSYGAATNFENFVTHSEFRPYVTQIGLYNDSNELVAHAKLGKPIKLDNQYDTSFIVRIDV